MPELNASASARAEELAALLGRVSLGDRRAFEALYHLASGQAFAVILRINPDRAQAEEVLQETFVNVWRAAGSYDASRSQAGTWLMSIARHRAIDSLRRRQAEPATVSRFRSTGDDDPEEDLLGGLASPDPGPLELLSQASERAQLERCMQRLSGEQRSSLALAYYQGLSHQEVALSLDQPLGTVKSWVRRGLQSLKSCLDRVSGAAGAPGHQGAH
jgi:RNA polymerase sigma-70 factor (ECF subfamily)